MTDDARSQHGFSCPGLFWLPGVVAICVLHATTVLVLLWFVKSRGLSEIPVSVAGGTLLLFWMAFVLVGYWAGTRSALNLIGLAATLVAPVAGIAAIAWWLWG